MKTKPVLVNLVLLYLICGINAGCAAKAQKTVARGLAGTAAVKTDRQPEVSLRIIKKNGDKEADMDDGDIITQADRYAIIFKPETDAHVYVFQIDTGRNKELLFPNPMFSDRANQLKKDESCRIPGPGKWFALDENKGEEHIILIASEKPLKEPEKILGEIMGAGCVRYRKMAGTRKTMQYGTEPDQDCESLLGCFKYRSVGGTRPALSYHADNSELFIKKRCFVHK